MGLQRRGFALMLVLVAAAAIFPVAMQAALELRAASIETIAIREAAAESHDAHSAAVLALIAVAGADPLVAPDGLPAEQAGADADEDPDDELPPIIRALVGDMLDDAGEDESSAGFTPGVSDGGSGGRRWRLPETLPADPLRVEVRGRSWLVALRDTASLLDLNACDARQARVYLAAVEVDEAIAARIADELIDYRDDDDFSRPLGAEAREYEPLGREPRNAPLEHVRELLYLPSMTPEVFERLRRRVTTSGDGFVNPATAPRELLLSLPGMSEMYVGRVLDLRKRGALTRAAIVEALVGAEDAIERMRLAPAPLLGLTVALEDSDRAAYEGWAVVGGRRLGGPALVRDTTSDARRGIEGER